MFHAIRYLASLGVMVLLLAACPQNPAVETDENGAPDQPAQQPDEPRQIEIVMEAQNDSGQDGTATLTEVDGQTEVVVDLENAPEGVDQPIHIHAGSCPDVEGVDHDIGPLMNGHTETTVDVSLDELLDGEFAINAHKSVEEIAVYVSCGDIEA